MPSIPPIRPQLTGAPAKQRHSALNSSQQDVYSCYSNRESDTSITRIQNEVEDPDESNKKEPQDDIKVGPLAAEKKEKLVSVSVEMTP